MKNVKSIAKKVLGGIAFLSLGMAAQAQTNLTGSYWGNNATLDFASPNYKIKFGDATSYYFSLNRFSDDLRLFSVRSSDGQAYFFGRLGLGKTPGSLWKLDVGGKAQFSASTGFASNWQSTVDINENRPGYLGGFASNGLGLSFNNQRYATLGLRGNSVSQEASFYVTVGKETDPSSAPDLFIQPDGNVGVGTITPSAKLDVNGSIKSESFNMGGLTVQRHFKEYGHSTHPFFMMFGSGDTIPGAVEADYTQDLMLFGNNGTKKYTLNLRMIDGSIKFGGDVVSTDTHAELFNDGSAHFSKQIRIGTFTGKDKSQEYKPDPNHTYGLVVENGILTERVKVALKTDWADYVFKPEYELMSLADVAKFIKENGHLPGMPSAGEVKKKGIDIAAMDAKLLEKIEEGVLYTLEQEEKIEKLEEQLKAQQEQIDELMRMMGERKKGRKRSAKARR